MSAATGCQFQRSAFGGEFLCTSAIAITIVVDYDNGVPHSEQLLLKTIIKKDTWSNQFNSEMID